MRICLNMIVRDEAVRLPHLLASLEGVVDACVVSDTGSRDDSVAVLRSWAAGTGIPCRVSHHPWQDFACNRNLALQEACLALSEGFHDCGWIMVIDPDEVLRVADPGWKSNLRDGSSYAVHVRSGGVSVRRPFLMDIRRTEWIWHGRVHNWIEARDSVAGFDFLPGVQVMGGGHRGAKSHPFRTAAEKAEADRTALLEELEGADISDGKAHRWFQLAHSCLLAGRHAEAAVRMSSLLRTSSVHPEIRYAAGLQAARSTWAAGCPPTDATGWLAEAASLAPDRWEAPLLLSRLHREAGDHAEALATLPGTDVPKPLLEGAFWLEHDVYEWILPYERAVLLHLNGRTTEAFESAASLLAEGSMPEPEAGFLRALVERIAPSGGKTDGTETSKI